MEEALATAENITKDILPSGKVKSLKTVSDFLYDLGKYKIIYDQMKNALKQELREKAKAHKITMGVLSIRNNTTEKQYVQSSLNMEALVNKIKFLLNGRLFTNPQLQSDWTEQELTILLLNL